MSKFVRGIMFDNLEGSLYFKQTKVVDFIIKNNEVIKCDVYQPALLPLEMQLYGTQELVSCIADHTIPPSRQNISDVLSEMHLTEYDPIGILKVTHGLDIADYYWIKFGDSDKTEYEQIKYVIRRQYSEV